MMRRSGSNQAVQLTEPRPAFLLTVFAAFYLRPQALSGAGAVADLVSR